MSSQPTAEDDLDNPDILTLRWFLASWMRSAQAGSQLAGRNLDGLALGWLTVELRIIRPFLAGSTART